MDFLTKSLCKKIFFISLGVLISGCGMQKLTNNKHINNIHIRHDQNINKNAGKIQVKSFADAIIVEVPKKLSSKKGKIFKKKVDDFLDQQAKPENLTATINIYSPKHLAASKDLKKYLQIFGIQKRHIQVKTIASNKSDENINPRELLIKTEYFKVYTPKCPDWSDVSGEKNSNFGCSTAVNIAVHVSNPRDLIIGRKLESIPSSGKVKKLKQFFGGQTNNNGNNTGNGSNNGNNTGDGSNNNGNQINVPVDNNTGVQTGLNR